ncbi:MAG: PQQ-dependent sugar dehydrogenase [Actinomycetota bacterium]
MSRASLAVIALAAVIVTVAGADPPAAGAGAAPEPRPFLTGLAFPTNLAFAPDGRLFYTEKESGNVRVVDGGVLDPAPVATFEVTGDAERGLLGIALDPGFAVRPWIYVYYSDAASGRNLLVRFREDRPGDAPEMLLTGLESAAGYHNGGDLAFGADGMLYASLGEAHDPTRAQDPNDLGGKIVRIAPDGSIPGDGPFGAGNAVWTFGHRNSFGLCVDPATGDLWETENGPDRDDELNLIARGGNYGWPDVTGRSGDDRFVDPVAVFPDTVALTGCAIVGGTLYAGAYNDGVLYELPTRDRTSGTMRPFASLGSGITDVAAGPDGRLYVATSDAIWTVEPTGAGATVGPASPTGTRSAEGTAAPANGGGGGGRPWIAAIAAVVLAIGLGLRFTAGRRLRADARDDGD